MLLPLNVIANTLATAHDFCQTLLLPLYTYLLPSMVVDDTHVIAGALAAAAVADAFAAHCCC